MPKKSRLVERDRKDAKFLECAASGEADWLITGDKDFTEAPQLIKTQIISVSQFQERFLLEQGQDDVKS